MKYWEGRNYTQDIFSSARARETGPRVWNSFRVDTIQRSRFQFSDSEQTTSINTKHNLDIVTIIITKSFPQKEIATQRQNLLCD